MRLLRSSVVGQVASAHAVVWIGFYLALLDLATNLMFAYPRDPRNITPTRAQQYFEYGRSIEGKYARITRPTALESAPIVSSGWLQDIPSSVWHSNDGGAPTVTVFGMSHAGLLAGDIAKCDSTMRVRYIGAPAAVPTWSYSAYLVDRTRNRSAVVILGVMTEGIPLLSTTTGATMFFDFAYPYTYPRFLLADGRLKPIRPPFASGDGFRKAFFDPRRWEGYVAWLAEHDKYYDSLLFRATVLDHSSIIRLLRRSYANASRRKKQAEVYDTVGGFNRESEEAQVLGALIIEFACQARADGSLPVIYIVNNLGTGDHAFRLLEPTLRDHQIAYLSSHEICPPNDARYYLPNSHFEPAMNMRIARAMTERIRALLGPMDPQTMLQTRE